DTKYIVEKSTSEINDENLVKTLKSFNIQEFGPVKKYIPNAKAPIQTNEDVRKRWTKQEEEILMKALNEHGRNCRLIYDLYFKDESVTYEKIKTKIRSLESEKAKPDNKYNAWTPEEDETLKKAVEKYGIGNWRQMADMLPGKDFVQFPVRWDFLTKNRNNIKWTPEEDKLLFEYVEKWGTDFRLIAEVLKRSQKYVAKRYRIKKSRKWTIDELDKLREILNKLGKDWEKIAEYFPDRNIVEIKKCVFDNVAVDPFVRKKSWSKKEVSLLKEGIEKFGTGNWVDISKYVGTRTRCQ
ncbi:8269_t:CDS:1, partial [Acaulospora morrowiae]